MKKKTKDTSLKEWFQKKTPQEAFSSSMTTNKPPVSILWRPHNYRRGLTVKTKTNSMLKKIRHTIDSTGKKSNYNQHTKILSVKDYMGITIQYMKDTIIGIHKQNIIGGHKETYWIEAYTQKDLDERTDQKRDDIRIKIDQALKAFARQFNIHIPYKKPIWLRHEDWIKGEEFIDSIPREVIIHDTYFKKVYGEGIEFKGGKGVEPTTRMKSYIKNRVIEDFAPEIAQAINTLTNQVVPVMAEFSENIKLHLSVMRGMQKATNKLNQRLSQQSIWRYMK